jgi:hypothetical protein
VGAKNLSHSFKQARRGVIRRQRAKACGLLDAFAAPNVANFSGRANLTNFGGIKT